MKEVAQEIVERRSERAQRILFDEVLLGWQHRKLSAEIEPTRKEVWISVQLWVGAETTERVAGSSSTYDMRMER